MDKITQPQKFFLYARKSTDVEDKQVLSIEAQITELRAYAKTEGLNVIEELIEKQSAKIPGRPIFNAMLNKVERGEANGIISWNPDRLARNSVDGGRIIYLLDCGHLAMLKFPTFWAENTSQGKFMLNIAFGQSEYYIDSLSENVRRGLRQKVRRGEYPGPAPIGYLNDSRIKLVVVDRKKAKIIKAAFKFYTEGNKTLEDVSHFLAQQGTTTKSGKVWHKDRVKYLLTNPFYYGHFRYAREVHEGKHDPIIAKKLFDKVQEVLMQRGRPRHKTKNEPQVFCGLLHCACGMMITGEYKVKRQKNGNEHHYIYYHCSRKSKTIRCKEPCIRQEVLDKQVSSLLQKVSLPQDWAKELLKMAEKDEKEAAQSCIAFVQKNKEKIKGINLKLQRLLDAYLEQIIERETYLEKKSKLMSQKKTLEEQIIKFEQKQNDWLEPFKEWINKAQNAPKIARDKSLFTKKALAEEIFGSNLRLAACKASGEPQNQWAALCAAHQNVNKIPKSQILVPRTGLEPARSCEHSSSSYRVYQFHHLGATGQTIKQKWGRFKRSRDI